MAAFSLRIKGGVQVVLGGWLLLVSAAVGLAEPIDDYNSALKFYEDKRWDFASKEFAKFLAAAPTHPKAPLAQLYQGQALTHARRFEAGRTVFREFLKANATHPEAPLAAYRIGESSFFLKDYQAANDELSGYVTTYPNHDLVPWGWQYLGESRIELKDAAGAVIALETVLKLRTGKEEQIEAKFFLARAQIQLGDNEKALAHYTQIAATNSPRAAEALFELASRAYEAHDYPAAAQSFEGIITRFAGSNLAPLATLNAGFARYQASEFPAAEKHFAVAIQDTSNESKAEFWLGMSRKRQEKWAEAIEVFQKLAAKTPPTKDADRVSFHWADCEMQRANYDDARKLFLEVVTKFPKSEWADDAQYASADAALRAGQAGEAIRLTERFPNLFPTSTFLSLNEQLLGRALLKRGDENQSTNTTSAQADYLQAVGLFRGVLAKATGPKTLLQTRFQLARAEKRLNHPQEVVDSLTPVAEAIRKGDAGSGEFADALPMLADALLALDKTTEAEAILAQAIAGLPPGADRRPTLVKLIELRAKQGQWEPLIESLNQLVPLDTDRKLVNQTASDAAVQAIDAANWKVAEKLLAVVIAGGPQSEYYVSGMSDLGLVLAKQERHAEAATCYSTVLNSPLAPPLTLAQAAFNQGVCLEKEAGEDAEKQKLAAETLGKSAVQFAIPAEKLLTNDDEKQIGEQSVRCAILAAELYRKLELVELADPLWSLAYHQSLKLVIEDPAAQTRPPRDEILWRWAVTYFEAENYTKTEELYAQLLKDHSDSAFAGEAKLFIAQGHDNAGRLTEARKLYQELETEADLDLREQALISGMNLEARAEVWKESSRIAQALLADFPQSQQALLAKFLVGEAQYNQKQHQAAFQTLSALAADPALAATATPAVDWRPQLLLLVMESKFDMPDKDYDGIRAMLPEFQKLYSTGVYVDQVQDLLGRIAVREARFDEGRQHFTRVIDSPISRKKNLAGKAQLWLADSFLSEKKYEEAIRAYTNLYVNYKIPEYQASALLQSAVCDRELKNWDAASISLERLIKEFPESTLEVAEAKQMLEEIRKNLPAKAAP